MDVEGVDLARYARGALASPEAPLSFADVRVDAEATKVPFTLVAVRDERVVAELDLMLVFRLRVDDVFHLWSRDDRSALDASVVVEPAANRLTMTLRFAPAGKPAASAAAAARFFHAAADGATLALRLPDGRLGHDRVPVPDQLRVEPAVVNLLDLVAEVSRLARVELVLPEEISADELDDLVVARGVLRGHDVRGTWDVGELTIYKGPGLDAMRAALTEQTVHDLLMVSDLVLDVFGARIELGEVQQQFSDAVVESVTDQDGAAVVRIRARSGRAPSVLRPVGRQAGPIEPHVVFPRDDFERMLSDDGDDEWRLRELL